MSASPAGLQKLIDICYNYSVRNSLTFNPTKSVCVVFKPKKFKLYCPPMVLNAAPLPYVDSVKYLGFMFTPDSKDDADMQRQLRTFYARSNTILRQFAKCDESVNPIRSGLFLENYCVNLHHIIHVNFTMCFWHDPIGIFQKFAILTILQRFQNKK